MTHPLSAADYLARLVAFPTVSAVSNLAMTEAIEAMVAPYGGRCRRFPNAAGDKANLLVTFGPEVPGGVLFSGHMDVVPCEGQDWTGDPWTLRQVGERVIGRGATDMKGFLACCLAAMPAICPGVICARARTSREASPSFLSMPAVSMLQPRPLVPGATGWVQARFADTTAPVSEFSTRQRPEPPPTSMAIR